MNLNQIQVGGNLEDGVVKIRCLDDKTPGGYLIQVLQPAEAYDLAAWLIDGSGNKFLRLTDGKRFVDHELNFEQAKRCSDDLIVSANRIRSKFN